MQRTRAERRHEFERRRKRALRRWAQHENKPVTINDRNVITYHQTNNQVCADGKIRGFMEVVEEPVWRVHRYYGKHLCNCYMCNNVLRWQRKGRRADAWRNE